MVWMVVSPKTESRLNSGLAAQSHRFVSGGHYSGGITAVPLVCLGFSSEGRSLITGCGGEPVWT